MRSDSLLLEMNCKLGMNFQIFLIVKVLVKVLT